MTTKAKRRPAGIAGRRSKKGETSNQEAITSNTKTQLVGFFCPDSKNALVILAGEVLP